MLAQASEFKKLTGCAILAQSAMYNRRGLCHFGTRLRHSLCHFGTANTHFIVQECDDLRQLAANCGKSPHKSMPCKRKRLQAIASRCKQLNAPTAGRDG